MAGTAARLPPAFGLGTYKITNPVSLVHEALVSHKYTHLDCAGYYGNEQHVGEGIKKAIESGVKREQIWVTSKLWSTYHAKEHVRMACQKSLDDLGLEYLDLYLVHWPVATKFVPFDVKYPPPWDTKPVKVPMSETWAAMEELVDAGLVRNIGVSNFDPQLLRDLLSYCRIRPLVNQVECHVNLQQNQLLKFCEAEQIGLTAYSPLARGIGTPGSASPLADGTIQEIARKHQRTPGQVLLRYLLQRSPMMGVIPKTSNPARLVENISSLEFSLSADDMKTIAAMDCGKRIIEYVGLVNFSS